MLNLSCSENIEIFAGANLYLFELIYMICFVLSDHSGLYASKIIQFSKAYQVVGSEETV